VRFETESDGGSGMDDAVVRDGLAEHWRESYVRATRKSMKAVELKVTSTGLLVKNRHFTN
jgi:hypothetical protein